MIVERFGELDAVFSVDGHLEAGNAGEAPSRVGHGLDQIRLALADGLELVLVSADVALVFGGIVGWEKNGATGEGGFEDVRLLR